MLGLPPVTTWPLTLGRLSGRLLGTGVCPELVRLLLPVLGRALLPVLGRALLPVVPMLVPLERTLLLVPLVAERLPLLALMIVGLTVLLVPWLPPVVGRTLVLLEPVVLRLPVVLPVDGRIVGVPLVERVPLGVVLLVTCGVTLVAAGRLDTLLLLVTVAALLRGAVATLRLPAAAALLAAAGRRPCAIAPVDVMASPLASIKPIIVL